MAKSALETFKPISCFLRFSLCLDPQSRSGRGASDQVDDRLIADQGSATPVLSDKGKHPMLYLVPFAGTRRKMADMDAKPGGIRQMLNPHFPQPRPAAVAASGSARSLQCLN